MLFLCYSRCSTCKKAQKWLDEQGIAYTQRDIRSRTPRPRSWSNGTSKAVFL